MQPEDPDDTSSSSQKPKIQQQRASQHGTSLFEVPAPVKRIFNRFPLSTYPANELPLRAPKSRSQHALYIFQRQGTEVGSPSCNPSCLKWQTFLKIAQIQFIPIASNNHASPSGALPFLLPSPSSNTAPQQPPTPIPASKLLKWAKDQNNALREPEDVRLEAYQTLLETRIRRAWVSLPKPLKYSEQPHETNPPPHQLFHLYLTPSNFSSVAHPCYITPTSTSPLIQLSLAHDLRTAATSELLKTPNPTAPGCAPVIDAEALYTEAEDAFLALSTLLGDDEWFLGAQGPGLLDASVFAYTHLLLDDGMGWVDGRLGRAVGRWGNLVRHRERVVG
ncbi:MAG: hypothetical protein M1820_010393, partial [Bogoriella megaspora]